MKFLPLLFSLALAFLANASAENLAVNKVRFYPSPGHEQDMVGGKIVASNDPSLPTEYNQESPLSIAGFTELAEIKTAPAPGQWTELTFPNTVPYRWIAYAAPAGSHGRISAIEFYAGDKKLTGPSFNSFSPHDYWRRAINNKPPDKAASQTADGQYAGIDCGTLATGASPTMTPAPDTKVASGTTVTLGGNPPGSTIRYTLDGTAPSPTHGQAYQSPIPVTQRTTIVAATFRDGSAPTPPTVGTYTTEDWIVRRSVQIGNSLTQLGSSFSKTALTAGYENNGIICGLGGAKTIKLWQAMTYELGPNDKSFDFYRELWRRVWQDPQPIDNFTMQPRDFNIAEEADYDIRFMNLVRKQSPDVQPWLFIEWTEQARQRPTDLGTEPTAEMQKVFPATTWEESMSAMTLYGEDLEQKILETDKGAKPPKVLPTALAVGWLHHLVAQGKYPDVTLDDIYPKLFCDDVHFNTEGAYLVECTWYAAFFGESPENKFLPERTALTKEQAGILARLAWDTIKNYPGCGYYEPGTTPVAAPVITAGTAASGLIPVTLSSPTEGAWFRYTLDGTAPTRTRGYIYCGALTARPGVTLKVIAYKSGMADSSVTEQSFAP